MLDIRFIREKPELVAEKSKQKGYNVDIKHLLELDERRRHLLADLEKLRAERNELNAQLKGGHPTEQQIVLGKSLKKQIDQIEDELKPVEVDFEKHLKAIPNMPTDDVPVGSSEVDNQVVKEWGDKPQFDFQPKTHWQLAESRGLIDKERAAKVAGSRFAYIKGDLVKLQFAILQFALDALTNEETIKKIIQDFELKNISSRPFTPVLPPAVVKTQPYEAAGRLNAQEITYRLADEDLWLNGSAEHSLCNMYMDEILPAEELPIRYLGYATSFRREAGSYGKDIEGIIRMHQFDKLEMESFTTPDDGFNEHLFMIAIQEYLMQQLELPYHVLNKCTADIGKPNARGVDIEAWLPGDGRYLETHTADFMTDYQARGLQTRTKKDDETVFVHTNDATAFAMGRTMVAIIENYQTVDGKVEVPKVLQPYMQGKTTV
jgi:seryl-tRNA synthetase